VGTRCGPLYVCARAGTHGFGLPDFSGVSAARQITATCPGVRVLLCSTCRRDDLPQEVAAAPVAGYVEKAELRPPLLRAHLAG